MDTGTEIADRSLPACAPTFDIGALSQLCLGGAAAIFPKVTGRSYGADPTDCIVELASVTDLTAAGAPELLDLNRRRRPAEQVPDEAV